MPVSDFECQIARGQIGRYLGGGMLSAGAMAGLEEHLADCAACKALVAERRATLLDSLGGEASPRAVVELPVENPLIAALRAKSQAQVASEPAKPEPRPSPRYAKAKPKSNLGKPLALAALLAVVLVGMSRLSHTATAPAARADASFAAETLSQVAPSPAKPSGPVKDHHQNREPSTPSTWKATPRDFPRLGLSSPPLVSPPRGEEAGPLSRATFRRPAQQDSTKSRKTRQAGTPPAAQGPWHQAGAFNPDAAEASPKANRFAARARVHPAATVTRRSNVGAFRARSHSGATGLRTSRVSRRFFKARRTASLRKRSKVAPRKAPRTSVRVYGVDGRPLKP